MPNRNSKGKIRGQPIIELQTDKDVVDTHIAIRGEILEIRKKKKRPVLCKGCLQFGHPEKYCNREENQNMIEKEITMHAEERAASTATKSIKRETNKNLKTTKRKKKF